MIRALISSLCVSFSCLMAETSVSLEEYARMIGNIDHSTQRIRTLNKYGSTFCYTTELTEDFLEHCRAPNCTYVLEVGCTYGIKSSQIVQTGVFLVANDLDPRHLEIMQATFSKLSGANPCFNNVRYIAGNFATLSEEQIGNKKYDAILCESVLHFMRPEEFRRTLHSFNTSLNSRGRIYITVLSPYLQAFRETFEINKANGIEWPGVFEDFKDVGPGIYHVVDEEILIRELKYAGFKVITSKYLKKPNLEQEYQHDGRDWLIAIAEKE